MGQGRKTLLTTEQELEVEEMMKEVDLSLLDWMLSLTPLERLRVAENYAETAWRFQNASQTVRLSYDAQNAVRSQS